MGRICPAAEHPGGGHGRLVVERPFCFRVGKGRAVPRVSPLGGIRLDPLDSACVASGLNQALRPSVLRTWQPLVLGPSRPGIELGQDCPCAPFDCAHALPCSPAGPDCSPRCLAGRGPCGDGSRGSKRPRGHQGDVCHEGRGGSRCQAVPLPGRPQDGNAMDALRQPRRCHR